MVVGGEVEVMRRDLPLVVFYPSLGIEASSHEELLSSGLLEGKKKVFPHFSHTAENATEEGDATRRRALPGSRDINSIVTGFPVALSGPCPVLSPSFLGLHNPRDYNFWRSRWDLQCYPHEFSVLACHALSRRIVGSRHGHAGGERRVYRLGHSVGITAGFLS
ncbi:hypothetical protein Taro_020097 [Colocasia esculenta]|uniref:Uncharacterized protein n=1 Tax=Colocasia esculenta TaxID=4460 RepID=A0A843UVI9_COLES|nr:hypothetical protein [Colocasia esculenta]